MKTIQSVIYTGSIKEQVSCGGNDDPSGLLAVGKTYETEEIRVGSSHTKVKIKDVDGWFNSVCFNGIDITVGFDEFDEKFKERLGL